MRELGRYPLTYNIWITVIKYGAGLNNGTLNNLLNAAYEMAFFVYVLGGGGGVTDRSKQFLIWWVLMISWTVGLIH